MWGSKGIATIWTWRVVGAELKDFCETVSSKHGGEKAPVLIRPLVQKLPIDFHLGWLWADDQPDFSASTKAKLSHLEAGSAFRDQHSSLTPVANLFPSGATFLFFFFFFWGRGGAAAEFQHNGPAADGPGVQFPPSISLYSVWVSNLLLQSGWLRPSSYKPQCFLLLFVQMNLPNITKSTHAYKTCIKKAIGVGPSHNPEHLL